MYKKWIFSVPVMLALVYAAFSPVVTLGDPDPLETLRAELIPQEGDKTPYGLPLSWDNVQAFADWYYSIQLSPEEKEVFERVLSTMPAPCCDDNTVLQCCCRRTNRICNLTRSALGLAAWLIHVKGFSAKETQAAVEEWLRFLKPEYYLSKALEERGLDPAAYGLEDHEAYESCDQKRCEAPLDAGGCGGMGLKVLLEREEEVPACCRAEGG